MRSTTRAARTKEKVVKDASIAGPDGTWPKTVRFRPIVASMARARTRATATLLDGKAIGKGYGVYRPYKGFGKYSGKYGGGKYGGTCSGKYGGKAGPRGKGFENATGTPSCHRCGQRLTSQRASQTTPHRLYRRGRSAPSPSPTTMWRPLWCTTHRLKTKPSNGHGQPQDQERRHGTAFNFAVFFAGHQSSIGPDRF